MEGLSQIVPPSAADLALWRPSTGLHAQDHLDAVLLHALARSHLDASVLRVLPIFLSNIADLLDWTRLRQQAITEGLAPELGLITELAGTFSGRQGLVAKAQDLQPFAVGGQRPYFQVRSAYERRLLLERTPVVAKKWGFLMNIGEDSFRAAFEKHRATL